jgi:hypothetical protein
MIQARARCPLGPDFLVAGGEVCAQVPVRRGPNKSGFPDIVCPYASTQGTRPKSPDPDLDDLNQTRQGTIITRVPLKPV